MKRGLRLSVFAVLIVAAALLMVYYFNLGPTGFAIFQQQTQADFDEGTYSNTLYNGNAVVLAENQTTGDYQSKVFDAGSNAVWNNLSLVGSNELSFEARVCDDAVCDTETFSSVDISNLNLSGRYFQYRALFDSSLSNDTLSLQSAALDYTVEEIPVILSVSLIEPTGQKASLTEIPLTFTATGNNILCTYDVVWNANSQIVVQNATITNCANITFSVAEEAEYTLYLYANVNGTNESVSDSTTFSIDLPAAQQEEEEETEEVVEEEVVPEAVETVPATSTGIAIAEIADFNIIQENTNQLSLSVQNIGTTDVTACGLTVGGDGAGLVTASTEPKNIGAGTTAAYPLTITTTNTTVPAVYTVQLTVTCVEAQATSDFVITVILKELDFEITEVTRTRDDRVRVEYSMTELIGEDQEINLSFSIKDTNNIEVGNATRTIELEANESDDFRTNIKINETLLPVNETTGEPLDVNLTLSVSFNSQVYSNSVLEPITLGTPIGGFAVFEGIGGTGGLVILLVVLGILAAVFVVVRTLRRTRKSQATTQ